MRKILLLLLLIPHLLLGQCVGNQSFTLSPTPTNNTYQPGTIVTLTYTMQGWNGTNFGANWLEGFGLTIGSGWTSYTPITPPSDCSGDSQPQQWLWMESVTSGSTGLVAGPGYFYEGPTGPIDGDPGNDWGDFGTTCDWTFQIQLVASDQCDPLSLLIEVTPYADGSMGSWGNQSCFDGSFPIFNGTIAGGDVNTSPITLSTDTLCNLISGNYSVINTPGSTYQWSVPGATFLGDNTSQIMVTDWNGLTGNQTVLVQETTSDGCIGEIIDTVVVLVEPVLDLGNPYSICPGSELNLYTSFGGGVWSGLNITVDNNFMSNDPGRFYPTYVVNMFGCWVSDSIRVDVVQPPVSEYIINSGDFLDLCDVTREQSYFMTDLPGVTYTWIVDGVPVSDVETFGNYELMVFWPDSTMTHYIEVYGTDSAGCRGEWSYLTIQTKACHRLWVPNSFTPNGDGFNDAIKVVGLSVYNLDFKIYDRFGGQVYSIGFLNGVWNGNDGSGYFCENGVYNWIATYDDDSGFGHIQKGHIVLIR